MEEVVTNLLAELRGLTTYEQVMNWNERAKVEMEILARFCRDMDLEIKEKTRQLESATARFNQKTFFRKLFSVRSEEIALTDAIHLCRSRKIAGEKGISELRRTMLSTLYGPPPQTVVKLDGSSSISKERR